MVFKTNKEVLGLKNIGKGGAGRRYYRKGDMVDSKTNQEPDPFTGHK